jgi:YgiT-type zinc finger domain-containing protein
MICHSCGGGLEKIITNLPFKIRYDSIIIIKELPLLQCRNCNEYLIEDSVMEKVDWVLDRVDRTAELEILSYAGQQER